MPKISGFQHMMNFVQKYLNGEMDRISWDLDFNHYLTQHYPKMERENSELADCFYFYLAEEGFDRGVDLSNVEHKKLIRKQWREFKAAMEDGIY